MFKKQIEVIDEKPSHMDTAHMLQLKDMSIAPYIQIATSLIGKERFAGGNMFRHQIDTFGILIDYGYIDPILLKASIVHDVIEDIQGYDENVIRNADSDGPQVLELVKEVTKIPGQTKSEFLKGIIERGSHRARILKCADRISNMISLGFVTSAEFIERYCDETEYFILPLALEIDYNMYREILDLVVSRRTYLENCGYFERKKNDD